MQEKNEAMKKKILILATTVAVITILLTSFSLVKTGTRTATYSLPRNLSARVDHECRGMTLDEIIDYSLEMTAGELQFDVQNDIAGGKANCVGYAQLCSAICNQALESNGFRERSRPVVGYVKNCGLNICTILKTVAPSERWSNFVKDHDFVELQINGKAYYFDASIYDVLGNKCLTIKDINHQN